jgi:nitronate monooxygenase
LADAARENRAKRWRDIWSAGHSTSGVTDIPAVENLVAHTRDAYRAADPQSAA